MGVGQERDVRVYGCDGSLDGDARGKGYRVEEYRMAI